MPIFPRSSAFFQVTALAGRRPVHAAFAWFHGNPKTMMDWQARLAAIPAPPFGKLIGVYVVLFFLMAQILNKIRFGQSPTPPIYAGGALIMAGGVVMVLWKG